MLILFVDIQGMGDVGDLHQLGVGQGYAIEVLGGYVGRH